MDFQLQVTSIRVDPYTPAKRGHHQKDENKSSEQDDKTVLVFRVVVIFYALDYIRPFLFSGQNSAEKNCHLPG